MANILIIYSTTDGHTLKICQRLRDTIERRANQVALMPVEDCGEIGLLAFDKIIIGASIRYGKHNPKFVAFVNRNASILNGKVTAFFSVNAVARKPEKCSPNTNPYVKKFLRNTAWKPKEIAVFAGKIDYPRYSPVDRFVIRLIMWITSGPTDPSAAVEFTDWQRVEDFADIIDKM